MIHSTAIIDKSAEVDSSAEIGPYAVIGPKAIIGAGVKVYPHAVVEYAEIGKNCKVFPGASIGLAPQDLKYAGEETKIIIGEDTVVRECVTLNRATKASGLTIIGKGCLFMAYTHVAHDCRVGDEVILANCATLAGHVEVGDRAVLGGLVGIHQYVRIGRLSMIGAGSMVPLDVPPYTIGSGDRMKLVGLNLLGLKRGGISLSAIKELKSAYQKMFMSNKNLKEVLLSLEKGDISEEVRQMVDFIKSSKRGICTARSKQ